MYYWNSESEQKGESPFYLVDEQGIAPNNSRPISDEAKEYYQANKEKLNINLSNIPGDGITLNGIERYGIDQKIINFAEVEELKARLLETDYKIIKCSEYQLAGLDMPYDIAELHRERQGLRDKINELE